MSENAEEREGRIWLERGIASARAGRRAEARQALFRALNYESQREMCWLWLAAVSEDAQQERVYLKKVLTLNPNSRFARAGLAHLDAQTAQNGAPAVPAGASTLGLLEPDSEPQVKAPASSLLAGSVQDPAPGPAPAAVPVTPLPRVVQVTVQEVIPIQVEDRPPMRPSTVPVEGPPAPRRAQLPVVEQPIAPPAKHTGSRTRPGQSSEVDLSGWTVETKTVTATQPAEKQGPAEPSGWSRSLSTAEPAPRPRAPKYEVNPVREAPSPAGGRVSLVLSEAFQSHETWTAMAATVSLAGLAVILIALAVMSVLGR
jgi:hypothetical protein